MKAYRLGVKLVFSNIIIVALLCMNAIVHAQTLQKGNPVNPTNNTKETGSDSSAGAQGSITDFKLLSETKDKQGNIVRKVQYRQGAALITEITISPPFPSVTERKPIDPDTLNQDSLLILVDKTNYLVAIIYKKKRIRQYRAVFGPDRLKDKMREGDRSTPEGMFRIVEKRDHNIWQKFMLLDYPTSESYDRFYERKAQHLIPSSARIGGAIGIHGIFANGDKLVDMGVGWTDGCVSLKSTDIVDLYRFVKNGTRVYVRR